jgi:putative hydrolase of the HAD superfamily
VPDGRPAPRVDAILLDAGGVLIFPSPALLLPPLNAAGVQPSIGDLERAHYRAMADCDQPGREPPGGQWWREYLQDFVTACGVPPADAPAVAGDIAGLTDGFSWTHVGPGVVDALRGIAALGLPLGIVSNSTGEVEQALRRLDVCYAPGDDAGAAGRPIEVGAAGRAIEVGAVIDSAVVGVSKPDPAIFALALDALGIPTADRSTVVHVGDSLRYDVVGALAAGVRPVHLDPHGYCPAPDGHEHIRHLGEIVLLAATARVRSNGQLPGTTRREPHEAGYSMAKLGKGDSGSDVLTGAGSGGCGHRVRHRPPAGAQVARASRSRQRRARATSSRPSISRRRSAAGGWVRAMYSSVMRTVSAETGQIV